ncbi:hypothetical protein D3C85_1019270 [compost metagenome]
MKALTLFANTVSVRDEQIINEHCIGIDGIATHFLYPAHLNLGAVQIRVEQRHTLSRPLAVKLGCSAGQ